MINNISNESQSINNKGNSSEITDILDQIKKKSEELSTSDASLKLYQNLSNPTNLTNPQIITSRNNHNLVLKNYNYNLPSIKRNQLAFSNDNIKKICKKSNSQIMAPNLNHFSTIDLLDLNNYHKLIKKAELEILSNKNFVKSRNKIILEKINKKLISDRKNSNFNRYNKNIVPKKVFFSENKSQSLDIDIIKEKINNTKLIMANKIKDKNIDIIKFIPKKEYMEKTNLFKILQFDKNNKNERYNKYLSLKNAQLKLNNNILSKLQDTKDFLEKRYKNEYILYIKFLGEKLEKEKEIKIDLINEKNKKLYEIEKLQKRFDKYMTKKNNLIRWLYLQIKVKEKKIFLPEYYKYIIEDNIPLDEINKKGQYNITINEYNRIRNYKGKNVYDNPNKFLKTIENLQIKALSNLNNKYDIIDEDKKIKEEFNKLKEQYNIKTKEDNKKLNEIIYKLKELKKENINLQNKLIKAKLGQKIKKKNNNKLFINKLLVFSKINSNKEILNIIQKNEKSSLFYLVLCLYYIVSMNNFKELENKKLILDFYQSDEKLILEILLYAENIIYLLLTQKKYYNSDPQLKKIYKEISEEIDKKTRIEKMFVNIKIKKQKEIEKREKLNEKINKNYIKPKRKIDYDYYRKEAHKKNLTMMMEKNAKNETKFEDFLYDIYS